MSYDPKCQELAECFLDHAHPKERISELAQYIQDSIEEWLHESEATEVASQVVSRVKEHRTQGLAVKVAVDPELTQNRTQVAAALIDIAEPVWGAYE